MERRAYDNKYLHKDFHASIDNAVAYIGDVFGEDAVKEYLSQYVKTKYSPMTLEQLQKYFIDIYKAEEAEACLDTEINQTHLTVKISSCPGMEYLNSHGGASKWYKTTTTILYDELAKLCGYEFEFRFYDETTGKTEFTFRKAAMQ